MSVAPPPAAPPAPAAPLRSLRCRDRVIACGDETVIMGILNVTPDSFFDGGRHDLLENALAQAERLVAEGAGLLDVGGQSTRPGFVEISPEEEIARVLPVIRQLAQRTDVVISIDTYKPAVARAALEAGAQVLNDIHGLQRAPELARLAADFGAAVVVMHHDESFRECRLEACGTSGLQSASDGTDAATDVIARLKAWFARSLEIASAAGIASDRIVLDPGIGFFKTQAQNLALVGRVGELHVLGCPLLLGASRKSFIAHVLDGQPVEERLEGTLATTTLAAWQGVEIVRVHDVAANLRAARLARAVRAAAFPFSHV